MGGVYDRLMEIFEAEEEPRVLARLVLEALREPRPEVVAAGVEPAHWRAAIDALLVSVDEGDAAAVQERRQRWSGMRCELEGLGCRLWQQVNNEYRWRIEGPSIEVDVDLLSGEISGVDYGPNVRFEDLVRDIGRMIQSKQRDLAEKARRNALRRTHSWDRNLKGWIPNDGDGPIIRGGRRA